MQASPRGLRAILAGMEASGVQGQRIIAAVSGGVDSVFARRATMMQPLCVA